MPTPLFGFAENPFAHGHDPRFLYPARSHREAVAHLHRALGSGEPFALLTGLPGVGKTVAVETALAEAAPHVRATIVASPSLTREEFLARALAGFAPGADGPAHAAHAADGIEARLLAVRDAGRTAILVVEEAQDLGRPLLDDLRLYSNLEAGGQPLLQIVLVGRPALEETLADPACDALRRRIAVGCRLGPLSAGETEGYIRHRTAAAGGGERCPFTAEACRTLHDLTHGIPGEIDQLASEALALANTAGEDQVAAGHIAFAVMMLGFRSAGGDAPAADEPAAVAEETVEAMLVPDGDPLELECTAPEAAPPLREEQPAARLQEAEVCVEEPPVIVAEAPVARTVAEAEVTPQPAAPAPRPARHRRETPPRARAPRARHLPRATAWTAGALVVVTVGIIAGVNSTRGPAAPPSAARVAVATPADEAEAVRPASATPAPVAVEAAPVRRPAPETVPAPAPVKRRPAREAAPAVAVPTAETGHTTPADPARVAPGRAYGVEVAVFLSESRAQTERERLAGIVQMPCHVVPSGDDGYAVVVGPVRSAKRATSLAADLSGRALVSQARVVRWGASGGTSR